MNNLKILTLDCETYDPLLKTYGMGWCFKYNYPETDFDIIGIGLLDYQDQEYFLSKNDLHNFPDMLLKIIQEHDAILCHNAIYDIGVLVYLFNSEIAIKDKLIIDTQLMAKHYDQSKLSYSLKSLCEDYTCTERKESDILHEYAWTSGIYQEDYESQTGRKCRTRPSENTLNKWCMLNLKKFPTGIVGEYCLQDIRATKSLYDTLMALSSLEIYLEEDSDILKICLRCKLKGVRIDLKKTQELSMHFSGVASSSKEKALKCLESPENFNIDSSLQLGKMLQEKGYSVPMTEKGNSSITSAWLNNQEDELFYWIRRYRKALKVKKDFIQKLLDYQTIIPDRYKNNNIGYLHISLKPYGATATGRFTSGGGVGCKELSIHQIPRRDEEFGAPLREIFLPHEGEELICGDFSSQESRLQVHYAGILGCTGAKKIVEIYNEVPNTDFHQLVAEICGISREHAKTINLGLSYGMGIEKLVQSLGLQYEEGRAILNQYHRLLPFLKQLQKITKKNIEKLGYIKTLGGRKLTLGPNDYSDKALNKLIQGSAADQIRKAMIRAAKQNLNLLFSVHDELAVSGKRTDIAVLEECMQTALPISVPMVVDIGIGKNWRDAK